MILRTKQEFQSSFKEFCIDNKARRITKTSLKTWCQRHKVKLTHIDSFISKHDLNKDNEVEYTEFVRYYLREEIKENFVAYDINKDMKITAAELKQGLVKAGHDRDMVDFEVKQIIEKMDANHDGDISYEEFATYYINHNYAF